MLLPSFPSLHKLKCVFQKKKKKKLNAFVFLCSSHPATFHLQIFIESPDSFFISQAEATDYAVLWLFQGFGMDQRV